ncbi:ORF45 [White spot syndrome virus]|uniref:Wsv053 n=3 Tax=White spot syndrome virus TaxID=342409 RepID=Q77J96_WSSVS|nr:wsv053 [Shrimp white spot syndrome virus]AAK77714.1 ORF45 [White spot syndrome virus]AYW76504.1 hypothetical protein [Procambarus clarkii virus]AAL33057.1 wsv053 [Shrimp white spot syndrome virus]AAL88978.1 WSSV110 [Shrimp white spot syndrome virus]AFX59430.1 wsv053 [White spot syndrome virus]
MTCPEISKHISGTDRRFWNTADPGGLSYPFNPLFTLHLHLKNFSKIFSAHSSLGGGPLTRPYVKFEGWTAGSTQRQITERS